MEIIRTCKRWWYKYKRYKGMYKKSKNYVSNTVGDDKEKQDKSSTNTTTNTTSNTETNTKDPINESLGSDKDDDVILDL